MKTETTCKRGKNGGFHAVVKSTRNGGVLWSETSATEYVFKTHAIEAAKKKKRILRDFGDMNDPAWIYEQGPLFLIF